MWIFSHRALTTALIAFDVFADIIVQFFSFFFYGCCFFFTLRFIKRPFKNQTEEKSFLEEYNGTLDIFYYLHWWIQFGVLENTVPHKASGIFNSFLFGIRKKGLVFFTMAVRHHKNTKFVGFNTCIQNHIFIHMCVIHGWMGEKSPRCGLKGVFFCFSGRGE